VTKKDVESDAYITHSILYYSITWHWWEGWKWNQPYPDNPFYRGRLPIMSKLGAW